MFVVLQLQQFEQNRTNKVTLLIRKKINPAIFLGFFISCMLYPMNARIYLKKYCSCSFLLYSVRILKITLETYKKFIYSLYIRRYLFFKLGSKYQFDISLLYDNDSISRIIMFPVALEYIAETNGVSRGPKGINMVRDHLTSNL